MPIQLYKKCKEFNTIASSSLSSDLTVGKISAVENTEPILRKLSDIKDFDERIEFADKTFEEKLGTGSSRTVYKINDELIIKISHNEKGLKQTLVEGQPGMQRECTNNAMIADPKGKWIIFKATKDMKEKDFKDITGLSFKSFMNALFYKFNNESDSFGEPKDYEKIQQDNLFKCLAGLVFDMDLLIGDLDKESSYGILDGKIVLRDMGLDKDTYDEEYASDSSSKSKSTPPKTSS